MAFSVPRLATRRRVLSVLHRVIARLALPCTALLRPKPAFRLLAAIAAIFVFGGLQANAVVSTSTVGATPGSFSVSPSGAATYTIPIVIAPGTSGMQPSLSLIYNSEGGNGILGVGWSIAGLSVIHRCGATIEVDGFKGGVSYDIHDRFCLDGERLIKITSTEYRTKTESLQKVVASDATTNPASFVVTSKDGTVHEYAVAIEAAGNTNIRRLWALSKVRDAHGNYLTITYDKSDVAASGDYRPLTIAYTGNDNTGLVPNNFVTFGYTTRTDTTPRYEGGAVIRTLKLVNKITSCAGSCPTGKVREYSPEYSYTISGAVGQARMVKITECGSDGACLRPTTFEWTDTSNTGGAFQGWTFSQYSVWHTPAAGDFNGDGRSDILINTTGGWEVFLGNSNGSFGAGIRFSQYASWHSPTTGDFNGDGRSDILINTTGGWEVFLGNPNGSFGGGIAFSPYASWHSPTTGDFNGDGRTDLLINTTGGWEVFLARGNGRLEFSASFSPYAAWHSARSGDFNGDGQDDVIINTTNGGWYVYASTGSSFVHVGTPSTYSAWHSPFTGDFNGDGKSDFVINTTNAGWFAMASAPAGAPGRPLLTRVTNGLGAVKTITYKPLTDASVYVKDSGSNAVSGYPYVDMQYPGYVVSEVAQTNGPGSLNATAYQYRGLKSHHMAGESLGFRWMQITDPSGLIHAMHNNQNREAGIDGTVWKEETYANGVRVKQVVNTWAKLNGNGGCLGTSQPVLTASVTEARELNNTVVSTVNTTNTYDTCGFPTTSVVDHNDGWKKTTSTTYNHDTASWLLGRPTHVEVIAEAPNQTAKTRTSSFTYTGALLSTETIEPGNPALSVTTTYGYDAFGNQTSKTVSGHGITTRTESQSYDDKGRFVLTKTNALNQSASFAYDARNGQLTSVTDINNLVTTSEYDGFGRKVSETKPDGVQTTITYASTSTGYSVRTHTVGMGDHYSFYDILGREIRSSTQAFGGHWIYADKTYDALGRVATVSNPDLSATPSHYTTFQYDALGRATSVTSPGTGNRTTTTDYNGHTTTVTNPLNQVKVEVKNSQGKTVSVTEAAGTSVAGTTTYQYDAFGNLISVKDPLNNETTLTYNDRGFRTAMTDRNMGTWSYTYNVLGELLTQTDAKNQVTTMTYDKLGRMLSRTNTEGISTWSYDTATNGKGKLASVTGPNNFSETYTYDTLSRPTAVSTAIGSANYVVTNAYDAKSRVDTITYPGTGYTVKQVYDNYGYLHQVLRLQSNGTQTLIWQASVADALGRITVEMFGNGVIGTRTYDAATGDLTAIQSGSGGLNLTNIQNLSY